MLRMPNVVINQHKKKTCKEKKAPIHCVRCCEAAATAFETSNTYKPVLIS
jgi:hypothetical protein